MKEIKGREKRRVNKRKINKRKMSKRKLYADQRGMLTVEAAVIIPICLVVLSVLVLLTIRFHDELVTKSLTVKYVNECEKSKMNSKEQLENLAEEINKYAILNNIAHALNGETDDNMVSVELVNTDGAGNLFGPYYVNVKRGSDMSTDFLRKVKVVKDIWK